MPNYDSAKLAKAQLKLVSKFQANELRFRSPEVYKMFLRNTSFMLPNYNEVKMSTQRAVELNYLLRQARALGSTISYNHTGTQGDSGVLAPTWTVHSDKIVTYLKESNNSIYSMEELHSGKLENVVANFAEGMETIASAYAFASRSQVNTATADGSFDGTDFVFKITESTNGDQGISITKVVMDANKYQGSNYEIICDSVAWRKFLFQAAQGAQNATNTSFQFGGVNFILDPKLSVAAAGLAGNYTQGAWIVVPEGSVGSMPWIEPQYKNGYESKENSYSNMVNPIDGTQLGVHSYDQRADGSASGGSKQDLKIETEFHIQNVLVYTPLSVADETPLQMFAFV